MTGGASASAWLLVAVALAGCAADEPEQDDSGSRLDVDVVDDDEPDADGATGRVSGTVLHEAGFPLPDAVVIIVSVDRSVSTDKDGHFSYPSVAAGDHVLRVEKDGYQTLQKPFHVLSGKHTVVEVVLVPIDRGFSEHYHDHWRGLDTYVVFDETVELQDDVTSFPACTYPVSYELDCTTLVIAPGQGRIVPPGTKNITIEIEFEPGPLFATVESMFMFYYPPPDSEGRGHVQYFQVASGSERHVYELPDKSMVDNGHAEWTDWRYELYWSHPALVGGTAYNQLFTSPVDVRITAHKQGLELDPPHERPWQDTDHITMDGFSAPSPVDCRVEGTFFCNIRSPNPSVSRFDEEVRCYYGCMVLAPGNVIPPGTTRAHFAVEAWVEGGAAPGAAGALATSDFVIGYKTAETPPHRATWDNYTWLEPVQTETDDGRVAWRFEVDVLEGEADLYYQRLSSWVFTAAVRGHEDANTWEGLGCSTEICGKPTFALVDFQVFNDDATQR